MDFITTHLTLQVRGCREARTKLAKRPWRVDHYESLTSAWFAAANEAADTPGDVPPSPFNRVIMFVDNAGPYTTRACAARMLSVWQVQLCVQVMDLGDTMHASIADRG